MIPCAPFFVKLTSSPAPAPPDYFFSRSFTVVRSFQIGPSSNRVIDRASNDTRRAFSHSCSKKKSRIPASSPVP